MSPQSPVVEDWYPCTQNQYLPMVAVRHRGLRSGTCTSALPEHRRRARKQDCSRFHTFTWVFPTACDKHALTEKPRKPAFCEASRFQSGNGTRSAKGPAAWLRTNLTAGDFTRSVGNCLGTHQACTKNGQQNITLANSSSSPVARLTSRVCNMRLRRTGTPSSYGLPKV